MDLICFTKTYQVEYDYQENTILRWTGDNIKLEENPGVGITQP